MREARRADGATIDPGGSDGDEESAVKARIATAPRPIKDVPRQTGNCFHKYESSRMSRMLLAIFGCSSPAVCRSAIAGRQRRSAGWNV